MGRKLELDVEDVVKVFTFVEGVIYRAKDGPYDESKPKYDCYIPCSTGNWAICDCWIVNEKGKVHPGLNACGVPICREALGDVVSTGDAS